MPASAANPARCGTGDRTRPDDRIVLRYEAQSSDGSYERVTEFYTRRPIDWNLPPDVVLDTQSEPPQSLLYIYCRDENGSDLPEVLQAYQPLDVYQDRCVGVRN